MFSQRTITRLSQRASQQLRSSPVRSTAQRRLNSTEAQPSWIADNAFNRERANVKHHAASTSGASEPVHLTAMFILCSANVANSMARRPLEEAVHLVRPRLGRPELRTELIPPQRRHPLPDRRQHQRLQPLERALGALGAHAPS